MENERSLLDPRSGFHNPYGYEEVLQFVYEDLPADKVKPQDRRSAWSLKAQGRSAPPSASPAHDTTARTPDGGAA
jgi:hypothetical protein